MPVDLLNLIKRHNGEKTWAADSSQEMDNRQTGVWGLMAARDIGACVFISYHNICYLTGFLYCYSGRKYAMVREIVASYPFVELMHSWTWFQSGINTDGAHNPVANWLIRPGDILNLNCFPMIFGYYTAFERTLFCDHASDQHLRLWEINSQVDERGLELLSPGTRCQDITAKLNEIYCAHDLLKYRSFGYGHSFGVLCHHYRREADVELREDVGTKLESGMVIAIEPTIMIPEGQPGPGGCREHNIPIISEHGAENITTFPFGPAHNIIPA